MEKEEKSTQGDKSADDVVSMADSTVTIEDIEEELFRIERLRDILVRRESELRYMMDDIQLCKDITQLRQELRKLVLIPDKEKSKEVEDVEFERLREREEDREMAAFFQSKFPQASAPKGKFQNRKMASKPQQTLFLPKTGLALVRDCCGFTCSIM
ncbi:hypothetical protein OJAV_G00074800 [Oryzias javanicus]|uniref:BMERB domain-containing protein n=1 Tax=Oryzias javanicus TaxID=123683 RepID=A0A3S2P8E6_ORYJA|nr:hypothetical protein OJAV_G00074800 [Oryzias javanicus]